MKKVAVALMLCVAVTANAKAPKPKKESYSYETAVDCNQRSLKMVALIQQHNMGTSRADVLKAIDQSGSVGEDYQDSIELANLVYDIGATPGADLKGGGADLAELIFKTCLLIPSK